MPPRPRGHGSKRRPLPGPPRAGGSRRFPAETHHSACRLGAQTYFPSSTQRLRTVPASGTMASTSIHQARRKLKHAGNPRGQPFGLLIRVYTKRGESLNRQVWPRNRTRFGGALLGEVLVVPLDDWPCVVIRNWGSSVNLTNNLRE